jgi:hypothetical protein
LSIVDPQAYYELHDTTIKHELARAIGRLNKRLENELHLDGAGTMGERQYRPGRPRHLWRYL